MGLDPALIARVVAGIPAGGWMSYGDVAAAAGGSDRHARTLNQQFIRHRMPGAPRVLMADGRISPAALGDAANVRRQLEAEGVRFDRDRASQDARVSATAPGDFDRVQ
jgi:alkylated DNA nucleotide flippase Atl1